MTTAPHNSAMVERDEAEGVRLVRIIGSLSQKGVADVGPSFAAAVRGEGSGGPVVVDLGGVDVIATTGITLLLVADRELKKAGGKMVLAGTRGLVRDVLLRCRLDKVLTLAPSVDEAVRSARPGE
jgi:anti-sigma B factor antagonist